MKFNNKFKIDSRYITLLLVSIPLAIIFYFAIVVRGDREMEILSNHFKVIGEIVNVRYKVVEVEYEINGRKYVYNDGKPYKNLVESENYECFVSKKDNTNAIILYSRPIIDTFKYNYDTINATHIEYLSNEIEILFDYEVKGQEYERIQNYFLEKMPKNFNHLKVVYRVENPSIGYLIQEKKTNIN